MLLSIKSFSSLIFLKFIFFRFIYKQIYATFVSYVNILLLLHIFSGTCLQYDFILNNFYRYYTFASNRGHANCPLLKTHVPYTHVFFHKKPPFAGIHLSHQSGRYLALWTGRTGTGLLTHAVSRWVASPLSLAQEPVSSVSA